MKGIDVSFSRVDKGWCERRLAEGYRVFVQCLWAGGYANNAGVRAVAEANLRAARDAGLITAGYLNTNPWFPAATSLLESKKNAGAEWAHVGVVFNDIEIAGVTEAQVQAHTDAIVAEGKAVALYSARWFWNWWALSLGHLAVFAEPLWYAAYDGNPTIGNPGFGIWTAVIGKQYTNTTLLDGVNVDLNEFEFFEEDDMPITEADRTLIQDFIISVLRDPEFDLDRINNDVKTLVAAPPGGLSEEQVRAIVREEIDGTKLSKK